MLRLRNTLCLDHIKEDSRTLPIADGLIIKKLLPEAFSVDLAYVRYDQDTNSCYIKTVADNFQTYIVFYEHFQDFIYMVDEAYYLIELVHSTDNTILNRTE